MGARRNTSVEALRALETLCQTYWYPLYAFIRRQGSNPQDAEDLTQAFFAQFLKRNFLGDVDRERGRFRSFLLASLKHFLANEWDRARAQKRGGGQQGISLDQSTAEERYVLEPRDEMSAEKIYERRWALTLLEQVLTLLRDEFAAAGKEKQFEALKGFLSTAGTDPRPYVQVAATLDSTVENVKVMIHRLRKRYRALLRSEIAHTVESTEEVEEEIRHLFRVLGG
jgi:RNA polymerase sigma-70 factor (ECF subfamily)